MELHVKNPLLIVRGVIEEPRYEQVVLRVQFPVGVWSSSGQGVVKTISGYWKEYSSDPSGRFPLFISWIR